jgi:hypothetical protein
MHLQPHTANGGMIQAIPGGWRLFIPSGGADRYRLAQLENYWGLRRRDFPSTAPRLFSVRARVSAAELPGTWGFGFWNDPFPASGFGPYPARLPVLPQAVWFFHASLKSYLSFRDDLPAHGLLAQAFQSDGAWPAVPRAALALAFSRIRARRLLGRAIVEDAAAVHADPTEWHAYSVEWRTDSCTLRVDDQLVLRSGTSPRPPLGLVIWIDNQYAAFTPQGQLSWGVEVNRDAAWLELAELQVKDLPVEAGL